MKSFPFTDKAIANLARYLLGENKKRQLADFEKMEEEILLLHIDKATGIELYSPIGLFKFEYSESPEQFKEIRAVLNKMGLQDFTFLPQRAVTAIIEQNNESLLLDRREHRAIFGGWHSGLFEKPEPRIFINMDNNTVSIFYEDDLVALVRGLKEELKITGSDVNSIKKVGKVIDLPLGYVNEGFHVSLKPEYKLDVEKVNKRELIGVSSVPISKLSSVFDTTVPTTIACLDMWYHCSDDQPYVSSSVIDNLLGSITVVGYPPILPHCRPEVIQVYNKKKMLELSEESISGIL